MQLKKYTINIAVLTYKLIRYNMKIIFADKLKYFLSGAFVLFLLITAINLIYLNLPSSEQILFRILLVPGILIIFYPITFGIQNDSDNRMLEIIFGIPNYRYKVQLLRLIIIFLLSAFVLFIFILLNYFAIIPHPVFKMLFHLMFPILFLGSVAFLITTFIRDGTGTSVIMIVIGLIFWIGSDFFQAHPEWNVFLNPFALPEDVTEMVWSRIVTENRIYLFIGSLLALLYGLLNLQKRERLL